MIGRGYVSILTPSKRPLHLATLLHPTMSPTRSLLMDKSTVQSKAYRPRDAFLSRWWVLMDMSSLGLLPGRGISSISPSGIPYLPTYLPLNSNSRLIIRPTDDYQQSLKKRNYSFGCTLPAANNHISNLHHFKAETIISLTAL